MDIKWQFCALTIILIVSSVSAKGKCIECNSSEGKCQSEPSALTDKTCEADNCFTLIENSGTIRRGCVNDIDKCDGDNCKKCSTAESATTPCNVQTDLFWCKTCSSSSAADCAYWQNDNSIPSHFCASGVTKCVMEITADKHTSRRCASKNEEVCENDKKCSICSDKACNKGVFPSDRHKCYQCSSDAESKCATPTKYTTEIKAFPCLFYDESEKCFEHGSSDTNMARGCLSDTTAYGKCSSENPKEKCKECTADSCNVDEYKIEATAKCIQCKTDDPKCVGAHSADDAKKCETKIEYWKPQGCYTNKIDGKVDRGCIQDFDCDAASTCTSCTTSTACNIADQTSLSCYKCRSDINPNCTLPLKDASFKSEPCRNQVPITTTGGEQCYIEKWNDIIIRSCLADADVQTRKNCLDTNYKLCTVCKEDNCNKGEVPNSAHSIALTSAFFALTLVALNFF